MSAAQFWAPLERIDSFAELIQKIDLVMQRAAAKNIKFAWRGQVDADWALHSSLYRRVLLTTGKAEREESISQHEASILDELRRWGLHSPPNVGRLSTLNQLAMLQHYGAPTRLIDISFNAWVGAWFAVEEKWNNGELFGEDKDARLFAIDVTNRLINESSKYKGWEDDLGIPWRRKSRGGLDQKEWSTSVYAWKPSSLDSRIFAQNGAFLFGGVPATAKPDGNKFQFPKTANYRDGWWKIDEGRKACCLPLRPHRFDPVRGEVTDGALYTFRISAAAKADIRDRLDKMFGYKHSTIYPDYTGFSSYGTPN